MKDSEPEISVFMPFYNERELAESTVEDARKALEDLGYGYELILVDDGSHDGTREVLEELAERDGRIETVFHSKNRGYGEALKTGFQNAESELVFYTDGDGQFDVREIEKLLEKIEEADMAVGYRENRQDSFSRELTSRVFNGVARFMLPIEERDIDCGFKLAKREALDEIDLETERTVDAELLAKARKNGREIEELPVSHFPREAGDSEAEGLIGVRLTLVMKSIQELVTIRRSLN